jgi:ATP-dependent RNA helicase RhlE
VTFKEFNLDPRLLAAVVRAGYTTPTAIQEAAIPPALNGQDLIGTAQTGTGKTAAFVLPILQRLLAGPRGRTRTLILSPTRELAEQTHETIRALGAGTSIRSASIYGGVRYPSQIKALKDGTDIIVACPGRLLDLMGQGYGRFDKLEVLVIDEADRMFDMGFLPSVRQILKQIPARRHTMLFSATFPREIEQLASQILTHPKRIAVGLMRPVDTVSHALYPVDEPQKMPLLLALLKSVDTKSVLVFARTKHRAERLTQQISRAGYKVTSLHGNRSQNQRDEALSGFKSGTYQVMVATDIAARGLDVEGISHVINYDMPDTADAYLHRIGRTGRAEHTGDAFTLATPQDWEMVGALQKIMGRALSQQTLDGFNYGTSGVPRQAAATAATLGGPAARTVKPHVRHFAPTRQPVRGFYRRGG